MSTGDIGGNTANLDRLLKRIKYPGPLDVVGLRLGEPQAALPLLHYMLLKYSKHVTKFILNSGLELQGKTDQRFVEYAFRLFRDVMKVRPVLTPAQFLEQGFAERKVLLLCDVVHACRKIHADMVREERIAEVKAYKKKPKAFSNDAARPKDTELTLNRGSITQVSEMMHRVPASGTDAPAHITYNLDEVFTETIIQCDDGQDTNEADPWDTIDGTGFDQNYDSHQQRSDVQDAMHSAWTPEQSAQMSAEQQQQRVDQSCDQDYSAWLADSLRRMATLRGAGGGNSSSSHDTEPAPQVATAPANTVEGPSGRHEQAEGHWDEQQPHNSSMPQRTEQGIAPNTPAPQQPSMLSVAASQELTLRQPMLQEQCSEDGSEQPPPRDQQQEEEQQQQPDPSPLNGDSQHHDSTLEHLAGALPEEVLAFLHALQARLGATEAAFEHSRASSRQIQESLQARVTVLEGRVRFLENTVKVHEQEEEQHQQQQQQWNTTTGMASTGSLQHPASSPLRRPGSRRQVAASPPPMHPAASRRISSAPHAPAPHSHALHRTAAPDVWHLRASAEARPSAAAGRREPALAQATTSQGMHLRDDAHSTSSQAPVLDTSGIRNAAAAGALPAAAMSTRAAVAAAADMAVAARSARHLQYQSTEELISSLATRYSEAQRALLDFRVPQRP